MRLEPSSYQLSSAKLSIDHIVVDCRFVLLSLEFVQVGLGQLASFGVWARIELRSLPDEQVDSLSAFTTAGLGTSSSFQFVVVPGLSSTI